MKILSNTTSPFARVARIALIEKGVLAEGLRMMNPWGEDAEMARLNPASRVPTLELPSGVPLTESLGVEPGGMVRIGLCHYNTSAEVDRLIEVLDALKHK